MKNAIAWINRQSKLWFTLLLVTLFFNGCYTSTGGCRDDVNRTAATVEAAKHYDTVDYGILAPTVIVDYDHNCEYVVIKSTVFCWRGTNLLTYTHEQ